MLSKLLNNQLSTFAVLVLLVGGGVALFHYGTRGSGETELLDEPISDDPDYLALRGDVLDMAAKPWNKSAFYRIRQSIREYAGVKPEPLINANENESLVKLLEIKYLSLIRDSVEQFCRVGRDIVLLNELEAEWKQFDNVARADQMRGIKSLAADYRKAMAVCGRINYYVSNEQCYPYKSDNLEIEVKEYQSKEFIRDNPYLQEMINDRIYALHEHSTLEIKVKDCAVGVCNCLEQFGKYRYYKNVCDSLQTPPAPVKPEEEPADTLKDGFL